MINGNRGHRSALVLRAQGLVVRLAITVLSIATIMTGCNPGCTTTTPSCDSPTCSGGQKLVCQHACVTPVEQGGTCSPDPCSPNGTCANDGTCIFAIDRFSCLPGGTIARPCDPAHNKPGDQLCASALFCRDPVACNIPGNQTPLCALPQPQNATCDSEFGGPKCNPCQSGLNCISATCRVPCKRVADCPCNEGLSCPTAPPSGAAGASLPPNFCYSCRSGAQPCDSQNPCCDGSTCSGATSTCCFQKGHSCKDNRDCCVDLASPSVCGHDDPAAPKTCQACHPKAAFCESNSDCCGGLTCDGNACKVSSGGLCGSGGECAGGLPCTCGLCAAPVAPGKSCSVDKGPCLCGANGTSATCTGGLCCLGKCAVCSSDEDCCFIGNAKLYACRALARPPANPSLRACCGLQDAPCGKNDDCCSQSLCTNGKCVATPGLNQHGTCNGTPTGCAQAGAACGSNVACCSGNLCRNGVCSVPTSFTVVGYRFDFNRTPIIEQVPLYTATIARGTPLTIAAQEDAFIGTKSPEQLIAINPGTPATPLIQAFGFVPRTLAAFPTTGAPSTADLVIAGDGQATWLERYDFVTSNSAVAHPTTIGGTAVSLSPGPRFFQTHDAALALQGAPNQVAYVQFAGTPIVKTANLDLLQLGVPIGVSSGIDRVWVLTRTSLATFATPALGNPIARAPLPTNAPPVAIAGGELVNIAATDLVVVAFRAVAGARAQILSFRGGNPNDPAPVPNSFDGDPVQLHTVNSNGGEFVFIVTSAPNRVLLFVPPRANQPALSSVDLGMGTPIDFAVGAGPLSAPEPDAGKTDAGKDGGGPTSGTQSGILNVILAQ